MFGCLLGVAAALTQHLFSQKCLHIEGFVVVRSLFPKEHIPHILLIPALYDLLKCSLAIIKELFILNIIQDKPLNELFCISKTAIQVNGADQMCIRDRFHMS